MIISRVLIEITGTYAVKVRMTPVPKDVEGCASMLILGDLSNRVVDELATLVDNVYAPLLCKSENHKDLPEVAVQDISRQVHLIRGTLYQVGFCLVVYWLAIFSIKLLILGQGSS